MLRNVVIDLGNNPGLSGVSMSGAQLCSIEDVTVTGTDFTAGVVGLPGSGGFTANLRVDGGAFAVWQAQFRPNPSVSGLVALNQSVAAVLLQKTRGPSSPFRVSVCAARTLNANGQSRVTLSLR